MKAYVFPGQGAQFVGMANKFNDHQKQKNISLGKRYPWFWYRKIMTEDRRGTQTDPHYATCDFPAFCHFAFISDDFNPDAVAGHSLGEFSALVAAKGFDLMKVFAWCIPDHWLCRKHVILPWQWWLLSLGWKTMRLRKYALKRKESS